MRRALAVACRSIVALLIAASATPAAEAAPAQMQAAVLLKLLVFHKALAASDSIVVYVDGSAEFAKAMEQVVGTAVGSSRLARVVSGNTTPPQKPDVIYLGDAKSAQKQMRYAREHDVLTVTGLPELMGRGATLGVGVVDGRVKVFYDAESSKEEGAEWASGLFKVVEAQ